MRISGLVFAVIFVSIVASVLALVITDVSISSARTFNGTNLSKYERISEIYNITSQTKAVVDASTEKPSLWTVLGKAAVDTWNGLRIASYSYETAYSMTNDGIDDLQLGVYGAIIKTGLLLLILAAVVFLLITVIQKWEV